MGKKFKFFLLPALATYSMALMLIEVMTSQETARKFYTDIEGPVPLYAINTTLNAFLLWSTALVFAVSIACLRDKKKSRWEYRFFLSQVAVFAYLGLDDRFQFHDGSYLNNFLGGHGDLTLLGVALLECFFLWRYGRILEQQWKIQRPLLIAATLFVFMTLIDLFSSSEMLLRLSLEDLSKTWANFFFFLFSWTICMEKINTLRKSPILQPQAQAAKPLLRSKKEAEPTKKIEKDFSA